MPHAFIGNSQMSESMTVGKYICWLYVIVLAVVQVQEKPASADAGNDLKPPPYRLNRADENYSYLRDPSQRTDSWDPVKYVPLALSGSSYFSLGGEVRERFEYFNNPNWGAGPPGSGYLLQRYLLHGDLHPGQSARFFIQLQSSLENNRKGGPRPTDKDELDVHQLFFDLKHDFAGSDSFVLRSGRQELTYGSQRIISVREAPNVRQSFDGFRTMLRLGEMQVDGFAVKPVKTQPHVFDDGPDHTKALWGTYAALQFPLFPEANIDVYYIGLFRRQASFDQGIARETRHSVGTRLWRAASPFDYNFEALYQWGSFGSGDVRAWTVASDTGYTFASLPFLPRIGLRADIASGDEDLASQDLQTFNPLFPKGAYFSQASLIGPANFFDLNPCLDLHLSEHLVLISDWDFFWRESTHDGLYNTAVVPVRSGRTSDARFIGSMPQVQLSWDIDRHVSFAVIYGHFLAGPFLKETGASEDVDYITSWLTYKF